MNPNKENKSVNFKKYHNYSLSFYQKDKSLLDVSQRASLGFENFQKNYEKIFKPRTCDLFMKFHQ